MPRSKPEWFYIGEVANSQVMKRIAAAASANSMSLQVKFAPRLAHWFVLDTLLLANRANRDGMHANALALLRQCVEAINVIEVGICNHKEAEAALLKWQADGLTAGQLRAWLQNNLWNSYGSGLWEESWSTFMREFAGAVQAYAHYCGKLAQWQMHIFRVDDLLHGTQAIAEFRARAYDPQKATRITLYHALLSYVLGRIWLAANPSDLAFSNLIASLGSALGKSRYLDGHQTNWSQQFWAMLWERGGTTILE